MKPRMLKKATLPAAVLATTMLLAGCSGGHENPPFETAVTPISTQTTAQVSDADLGAAMDKLVFHSTSHKSHDDGACFVQAARNSGVSPAGLAHIIEANSDDLAELAETMRHTNPADASVLASLELRDDLDDCLVGQAAPADSSDGGGETTYEAPEAFEMGTTKQPNLTPQYPLGDNERVHSASQLTEGLVAVFSSYALDEQHEKIYEAAGECSSGVVFEAGFSDEALRFLAEGAPIGTGSVAAYLPTEQDKKLWKSQDFTTALADCTTGVGPISTESSREVDGR